MDRKIPLFLDVDGVLNACCRPIDLLTNDWGDFQIKKRNGYGIQHSKLMGESLAALDAEIIWLTTWCHDANKHIRPLFGWEKFSVLDRPQPNYRSGSFEDCWWKSTVLEAYLKEHPGPFIWIDDDYEWSESIGDVDWIKDYGHPYLAISPKANIGITTKHIEQIKNFIEEQNG